MAAKTGSRQHDIETVLDQPLPFPLLLRLFWVGVVLLAVLTIVSTLLARRHGAVYPYSNPIFPVTSWQLDFLCFSNRFAHFGTPAFYTALAPIPFTYPAPLALVYQFFYGHTSRPHLEFMIACVSAYGVATGLFARALAKRRVRAITACAFAGTVAVLSYPAILQLFVLNMEIVVWIAVALGIWAYVSDRHWSAAACFALAASFKIFPFVFFALLLSRKKYKEIAFGALVFLAITLVSLHLLGPDIRTANREINDGLKYFQDVYIVMFHAPESGMDHSLFAVIKLGLFHWRHLDLLRAILRPYLLIAASIGLLLYLFRIRRLPIFNQILAITVASVLLPPVSHDYTLLYLYTPFVLLTLRMLNAPSTARDRKLEAALLVCFLVLFSSENYAIWHGIRFAGQIKACVLLLLFAVALRCPFDANPFPASETRVPLPSRT